MSVSAGERKSIFSRGFIALFLLVVFLALALILPRIIGFNGSKLVFNLGIIYVNYEWIGNNTLQLNITNNYYTEVVLDKIVIGNKTWLLNNTVVDVNSSKTIVLKNVYIERTCLAKIYYYVGNRLYRRIVVIEPPHTLRNQAFLNLSSRSTRPLG